MQTKNKLNEQTSFLLTMAVLALVLRMPITGVGPILTTIREDLGVSNTVMGLLTSVPMMVFAVISPLAAVIERKIGMGRAILSALILILVGELVRSYTNAVGLFAGTAILACGIGMINVLGLTLIKLRAAPERVGMVISVYSTIMAATAAISIAASVPIANALGWRTSLAAWVPLAVLAVIVWGLQHRRPENQLSHKNEQKTSLKRLLRSPLAWHVTLFMGAQTLIFYCVNGWIPTILQSRGFTIEQSAVAATVLQVTTLPFTFIVPLLLKRVRTSVAIAVSNLAVTVGVVLFILNPGPWANYTSIMILSAGMGGVFSICNLTYSQRTRNPADTAALSGMANCFGYVVAAFGPSTMGRLFDMTHSWLVPLLFLLAMVIVNNIFSQLSCRERYLFDD